VFLEDRPKVSFQYKIYIKIFFLIKHKDQKALEVANQLKMKNEFSNQDL